MISVEDALGLIDQCHHNWGAESISIDKAAGRTLAEDVLAPRDLPDAFDPVAGGTSENLDTPTLQRGDTLLSAGLRLNSSATMLLASCNIFMIKVKRFPSVGLIRCGDELTEIGRAIGPHEKIDSVGPSLKALLGFYHIETEDHGLAKDNLGDIKRHIQRCQADIIVPIGGTSAKTNDIMNRAIRDLGFISVFNEVEVDPGKPLWMAKRDYQFALGLPGSPFSAWACAQLFLLKMIGVEQTWARVPLANALRGTNAPDRLICARLLDNGHLDVLKTGQQAGALVPAQTQFLIWQKAKDGALDAGTEVDCLFCRA